MKQIIDLAKGWAIINEKEYVTHQDIKETLPFILRHRIKFLRQENKVDYINKEVLEAADAFGAKGIMVSDPADLDDAIMEMLSYDGPVLFDCLVEKHENCFPMIPSGEPHNKMLLGEATMEDAIGSSGAVLV